MILRLGVGEDVPKEDGYLNVDIRKLPNIDIVADAKKLPFKDGEVDGIESRNLVEHFDRKEIGEAFKEWARVIKPQGSLFIETIDMGLLMDNWHGIETEAMLDGILGAQTYPENYHKMAFTQELMAKKLDQAGFAILRLDTIIHRGIPRMKITAGKL